MFGLSEQTGNMAFNLMNSSSKDPSNLSSLLSQALTGNPSSSASSSSSASASSSSSISSSQSKSPDSSDLQQLANASSALGVLASLSGNPNLQQTSQPQSPSTVLPPLMNYPSLPDYIPTIPPPSNLFQPVSVPTSNLPSFNQSIDSLFDQANQLTPANKQTILNFLSGDRINPNPEKPVQQFLLNLEKKINPENGVAFIEQLIFEINYEKGTWRKLRRKKNVTSTQ